MSSPSPEIAVVVYGASGLVGRATCEALATAGIPFAIAGRSGDTLARAELRGGTRTTVAKIDDPAALARAFAGARVVVNAAGPLRDTAESILLAAIAARAHYIDVGGEQRVLQLLHERHESAVRRAGLVALPGAGLDAAIGDLAAGWAALRLTASDDEATSAADDATRSHPTTRTAPTARLADARPLDEVCTSYVFDDLALSAGSQRALFGTVGSHPLIWRRDRWEAARSGERRRINAGTTLGGEREAFVHAGGDVITIPRHVAALYVASFLSTVRGAAASRALGLLARALPFVPRSASQLLAPYAAPPEDCARTRFAVVAQVRRGFAAAQLVIRGSDPTRTTAEIAAWCAGALATRGAGPIGMCAPSELFRAEPALRAIARIADLVIEPSFA